MKAIKLASVFAVSAVAAAVSTSTIAADAVISGEAGIEYTTTDTVDSVDGTDLSEIELSVDTGVVYAELEIAGTSSDEDVDIGLEKIYVTQGAVSFGRFDGSVSTGAFMGSLDEQLGGVDLTTSGDTDDAGVRYKVTPEFTVALEATDSTTTEDSDIGVAASYVTSFDAIKVGISGGSVGDANAVNVGFSTTAGPLTISLDYGVGASGATGSTDVEKMTSTASFAATEELTFALELANNMESKKTGTYFIAEYAVGDLTYYLKNFAGDLNTDSTSVGVTASF
ncbi:hypothetical protein OFY17_00290 [Marinomonas sp. C2222]|uniref:Porin domain-containing protein n=1 Tax=Marinomonas sargassi TaxID=2984494 RepID=A0ABT2YN38_9GAMM|nr:hypothetical protein [Marinomonas sargassi]MCV2401306.1 hypothetical protein [Marinomonas sargassi]